MKKSNKKKKILSVLLVLIIFIIGIYLSKEILFKNNEETSKTNYNNTQIGQNNAENIENELSENDTEIIGLFEEYYGKAEELLSTMSLEEKIGQMFLVRYPEKEVINEIKEYAPGGYILFGRDFKNETKQSILEEINDCQNASKIKMIFGVDEEGGTVVRVSAYKAFRNSKFKSPQDLWKDGGLPAILQDSNEKSSLLKSIGINMNLTPVADVPTKESSFMYNRSFGRGANVTAEYVSELIKAMNSDNMLSAMKHFPGYGDNTDTHTGIAIDNRPLEEFENNDFLPFKSGIEAKAPTILVSHNIVNCMDENMPASLSKKVHDILRNDLYFTGLIITDDLAMDAVKSYVKNGEAAVQAVLAGNDMIISSDFETQRNEVLNAVKQGQISEDIINTAVKRILACKYAYKIIT